ncbi:MAG: Bro-N domain-containing protein [Bacteroidales bacterium]|nr:Bro-N domain-containing protein [Bacteroidales bacterium]
MKPKNKKQTADVQEAPELFTFDHNHKPVRVEMIDGEPWFVAKDVCDILNLTNSRKATNVLDDDEKSDVTISDTRSKGSATQKRKMTVVNESGLYNLIFQSRKPEARAFRKWVTSVLLPVVRKTGKYAPGRVENDCPYTQPDVLEPPAFCQATPEWMLDLMNDVCRIEDAGLRIGMADKLMSVKKIDY